MAETAGGWVKSPENPVLGGNLGVCFDISMIRDQDEKGILYRMWFSWRTKESIAYTESRNGIQWSEPQVVLTPAGGWEERLNRPCVVQKDGKFHLWYTGQTWEESRIGYAVSADGVNWERVQTEPVMVSEQEWEKVAVMCPHVLWDAEKECFRMWYSAGEQYEPNAIGYAESKDGITWEKSALNPIFSSDADFHWERHKVTAAQVFPLDGWYVMFYIGFENENLARIGVARSRDGQTNWERLPANPIISPDAGAWDAEACYKPFVLKNEAGDGWKLWYNGRTGQVEQIGMATHTGLDLGFAKDKTPKPLPAAILNPETYRAQMEQYSANDEETVKEYVPNMAAWAYLKNTMPLLDFPDKKLENVWYFRWWTFRKHIRRIPDGTFIVTEFLPKVPWSGAENSISCPAGHHFREGRWLADPRVLSDYGRFWAKGVGRTRQYSFWLAASLWQHALATGDTATMKELLPDVIANYQAWEKSNLDPNGLFWQIDNNDGMEVSVGGSGYRATINTYMIMETTAIANIAELMLREKTETAGIAGIAETD
ncbi:MAG: hypothetical protein Q4C70_12255 [Planctomycetia bacterium]|nr:hypothetical protein [Planctomycetia bacterium]